MTPDEARRIDPSLQDLSDEELVDIVWRLEGLAELALSEYFEKTGDESVDQ